MLSPAKDTHGLLVVALPKASVGSHTIATKVACSNGMPESVQETTLAPSAPIELPTSVGTVALRANPAPTSGVERIALEVSPGLRASGGAPILAATTALALLASFRRRRAR